MEISNLIPHIESLIFASDKPLTSMEITDLINQAFGFMEDKIAVEQVDSAIEGIVEKYTAEFYPFEVRQSGGGWQFLTKKDYHKTVAQLNGEKFLKKLSAAALETLAIIAYKQPVTKGEIEAIRGVSSDYAVQKLLEKELIIISGRNEKLPGHPLVYATSKTFMDYFGINSPEDLPRIKEVLADQLVEPTVVNHTIFEASEAMSVSDVGELVSAEEAQNSGVEESHVNGHSFEAMEVSEEESGTEQDLPGEDGPEMASGMDEEGSVEETEQVSDDDHEEETEVPDGGSEIDAGDDQADTSADNEDDDVSEDNEDDASEGDQLPGEEDR